MSERRTDETKPIAPRRSLSAPTANGGPAPSEEPRRPLSERVSAAIASAGKGIPPASPSGGAGSGRGTPPSAPASSAPASAPASSAPASAPASAAPRQAPAAAGAGPSPTPAATPVGPRFQAPAPAPRLAAHRTRKARLRLTHLDPWSVMKTSFLLSVAIGVATVVAVAVVWGVLGMAGVWDSINRTVIDVLGSESASDFDIEDYLGTGRVLGFTMIVAVVDVVLITAIATLGAFLYNLSAALLGGLEVTLAEDDR